jgi:hypothetical protein
MPYLMCGILTQKLYPINKVGAMAFMGLSLMYLSILEKIIK